MNPSAVFGVLQSRAISHLHHANTVTTSCTFLQEKGLASRGYVADGALLQTPQYTDDIDQRYGIWHDVFIDTVDIHERASRRNQYGPVLFVLDAAILNSLPPRSEVLVTRRNPTKWRDGEPDTERYFSTPVELQAGLVRGEFDQMIVIRTPTGILPFPGGPIPLVLDNPQRSLSNGQDAHAVATACLASASGNSGTPISIQPRVCRPGCRCANDYARMASIDAFFQ